MATGDTSNIYVEAHSPGDVIIANTKLPESLTSGDIVAQSFGRPSDGITGVSNLYFHNVDATDCKSMNHAFQYLYSDIVDMRGIYNTQNIESLQNFCYGPHGKDPWYIFGDTWYFQHNGNDKLPVFFKNTYLTVIFFNYGFNRVYSMPMI